MRHLLSEDFFTSEFPLHLHEVQHGTLETHCHEFFELVYLIRGQGIHRIGSHSYPIQAGDVYVISPNEPHAYYPRDGAAVQILTYCFCPVCWMNP